MKLKFIIAALFVFTCIAANAQPVNKHGALESRRNKTGG